MKEYDLLLKKDFENFEESFQDSDAYYDARNKLIETLKLRNQISKKDTVIDVLKIAVPVIGTFSMFLIGLSFEETGVFRSSMVRNLLKKIC